VQSGARHCLNDFRQIRANTYDDYVALHADHLAWIVGELTKQRQERTSCLVVTHHCPVAETYIAPNDKEAQTLEVALGAGGSAVVGTVVTRDAFPNLVGWCFGHTHWNVDRVVSGIRVLSNQWGYTAPCEPYRAFKGWVDADVGYVFEVGGVLGRGQCRLVRSDDEEQKKDGQTKSKCYMN